MQQNKIPIKFVEMGSKMFRQLFLINKDDPSRKLDEFLFGINDGDYIIERARELYDISDEYDTIDKYQDNFKRLDHPNQYD